MLRGRLELSVSAPLLPLAVLDASARPKGMPQGCEAEAVVAIGGLTSRGGHLDVRSVGVTIRKSELLADVSFQARCGSLTAVIGPSGAGKSTLARVISGIYRPTTGSVYFTGHDLYRAPAAIRHEVGVVPQCDTMHDKLTVEQAVGYAAELRLPDATRSQRNRAVANVLCELELSACAHMRIDKLSGGQRKRTSVAMELLTEPSLLILDEPTSGLDPALDRQVMTWLRKLADAGRVVVVITHCLTYLNMCEQVLILASGRTAYCGPPSQIPETLGTSDWADIFTRLGTDPEGAHRNYLACGLTESSTPRPTVNLVTSDTTSTTCSRICQLGIVARRHGRLLVADRGYLVFLAVLPLVVGVLSLVVPGDNGFGRASVHDRFPNEPSQVLELLNIDAIFMGAALTIREIVGERIIFEREQAAGLSASAYIMAKLLVSFAIIAVQTAVVTAITVTGKGAPTRGGAVLGDATLELYVVLFGTGAASLVMGLALSATARTQDQILPMLVLSTMVSIVFSGGLIPMTGRPILNQLSWLIPARWGFAASASTTDLSAIAPFAPANETLWAHTLGAWVFATSMLCLLSMFMIAYVRWRIRGSSARTW